MIPDEAVEAAALALAAELGYQDDDWAPEVRVILEAAAPHMIRAAQEQVGKRYAHLHQLRQDELQAQAWEACAQMPSRPNLEDNPYRKP